MPMQYYQRDAFAAPANAYSDDMLSPPLPSQYLTRSMQQRPELTAYNSQQFATPQRNPFNDSNLALSHRSVRKSSRSIGVEQDHLNRRGYNGPAAGSGIGVAVGATAGGVATRLRDGNQSSRTQDRSSSYRRYSDPESLIASDPLPKYPVLQPAPHTANTPYSNPALMLLHLTTTAKDLM